MAASQEHDVLGATIASFSRDGHFPLEDEVSATHVQSSALPGALRALALAKLDLEKEIRNISSESAPEVDSWIQHAKALKADIDRSRNFASETTRQADAGDILRQAVKAAEDRVEFLSKEATYSQQVGGALQTIKDIRDFLDRAEQSAIERKILEALQFLSSAWDLIYAIPMTGRTRAVRLLDERAFRLRASIHENSIIAWRALVAVDVDAQSITIRKDTKGKNKSRKSSSGSGKAEFVKVDEMNIDNAIVIMKAYDELDDRIKEFSDSLEDLIIKPRVDLTLGALLSIDIQGDTLRTSTVHADSTVKSLLSDLERAITYLNSHLPSAFIQPLSAMIMPKLCSQIKDTWLDSAVPASLDDMTAFRKAITLVQVFAENLKALNWTGAEALYDWVANAPRIWLTKRREKSLDWTRNQLSLGIGTPRKVDRVETQKLSRTEGKHVTANRSSNGNDWDAAWSDDEPDDHESILGGATTTDHVIQHDEEASANGGLSEDDDAADAWGWGDEEPDDGDSNKDENRAESEPIKAPTRQADAGALREVTLTEKYTISSMPDPVFKSITSIIEDGTILTKEINEQNPVAAAAAGVFALPTLVLAMYRAVSPYFYTLSSGGNMYLYNDAMWLADQLREYTTKWTQQEDLSPRARGKVKLDGEIQIIEKFGRRAYAQEMKAQRTVLNDLLGGTQNFLSATGDEIAIDSVVAQIRSLSAEWKGILSKSAWAQATGSLLSTVAKKIILDVQDCPSLGADEAYRVANLISRIVKLDELFIPEDQSQPQIPVTSQYAPNWLKLQFLSEVLQSDLKEVKYLWFESELSLYFTAQEVVDLIELSFENNHRTREAIASIRANPQPKGMNGEEG